MTLKKNLTLILLLTILASCASTRPPVVEVKVERETNCFANAESIAWLLANGERQFVVKQDANNTLAGGC